MNAFTAEITLENSDEDVACPTVRADMVVVARVELPYTIRVPDAEMSPVADAVNPIFCVHAIPFQ